MPPKYKQGFYKPINPHKYDGDIDNIISRSSWERHFQIFCDTNPSIVSWSSESIIIPYISADGKPHRYFPDFFIKIRKKSLKKYQDNPHIQDNETENYLIEIKPFAQTPEGFKAPKNITDKNRRSVAERALVVDINRRKWDAAKEWCRKNNATFLVLTEKELYKK